MFPPADPSQRRTRDPLTPRRFYQHPTPRDQQTPAAHAGPRYWSSSNKNPMLKNADLRTDELVPLHKLGKGPIPEGALLEGPVPAMPEGYQPDHEDLEKKLPAYGLPEGYQPDHEEHNERAPIYRPRDNGRLPIKARDGKDPFVPEEEVPIKPANPALAAYLGIKNSLPKSILDLMEQHRKEAPPTSPRLPDTSPKPTTGDKLPGPSAPPSSGIREIALDPLGDIPQPKPRPTPQGQDRPRPATFYERLGIDRISGLREEDLDLRNRPELRQEDLEIRDRPEIASDGSLDHMIESPLDRIIRDLPGGADELLKPAIHDEDYYRRGSTSIIDEILRKHPDLELEDFIKQNPSRYQDYLDDRELEDYIKQNPSRYQDYLDDRDKSRKERGRDRNRGLITLLRDDSENHPAPDPGSITTLEDLWVQNRSALDQADPTLQTPAQVRQAQQQPEEFEEWLSPMPLYQQLQARSHHPEQNLKSSTQQPNTPLTLEERNQQENATNHHLQSNVTTLADHREQERQAEEAVELETATPQGKTGTDAPDTQQPATPTATVDDIIAAPSPLPAAPTHHGVPERYRPNGEITIISNGSLKDSKGRVFAIPKDDGYAVPDDVSLDSVLSIIGDKPIYIVNGDINKDRRYDQKEYLERRQSAETAYKNYIDHAREMERDIVQTIEGEKAFLQDQLRKGAINKEEYNEKFQTYWREQQKVLEQIEQNKAKFRESATRDFADGVISLQSLEAILEITGTGNRDGDEAGNESSGHQDTRHPAVAAYEDLIEQRTTQREDDAIAEHQAKKEQYEKDHPPLTQQQIAAELQKPEFAALSPAERQEKLEGYLERGFKQLHGSMSKEERQAWTKYAKEARRQVAEMKTIWESTKDIAKGVGASAVEAGKTNMVRVADASFVTPEGTLRWPLRDTATQLGHWGDQSQHSAKEILERVAGNKKPLDNTLASLKDDIDQNKFPLDAAQYEVWFEKHVSAVSDAQKSWFTAVEGTTDWDLPKTDGKKDKNTTDTIPYSELSSLKKAEIGDLLFTYMRTGDEEAWNQMVKLLEKPPSRHRAEKAQEDSLVNNDSKRFLENTTGENFSEAAKDSGNGIDILGTVIPGARGFRAGKNLGKGANKVKGSTKGFFKDAARSARDAGGMALLDQALRDPSSTGPEYENVVLNAMIEGFGMHVAGAGASVAKDIIRPPVKPTTLTAPGPDGTPGAKPDATPESSPPPPEVLGPPTANPDPEDSYWKVPFTKNDQPQPTDGTKPPGSALPVAAATAALAGGTLTGTAAAQETETEPNAELQPETGSNKVSQTNPDTVPLPGAAGDTSQGEDSVVDESAITANATNTPDHGAESSTLIAEADPENPAYTGPEALTYLPGATHAVDPGEPPIIPLGQSTDISATRRAFEDIMEKLGLKGQYIAKRGGRGGRGGSPGHPPGHPSTPQTKGEPPTGETSPPKPDDHPTPVDANGRPIQSQDPKIGQPEPSQGVTSPETLPTEVDTRTDQQRAEANAAILKEVPPNIATVWNDPDYVYPKLNEVIEYQKLYDKYVKGELSRGSENRLHILGEKMAPGQDLETQNILAAAYSSNKGYLMLRGTLDGYRKRNETPNPGMLRRMEELTNAVRQTATQYAKDPTAVGKVLVTPRPAPVTKDEDYRTQSFYPYGTRPKPEVEGRDTRYIGKQPITDENAMEHLNELREFTDGFVPLSESNLPQPRDNNRSVSVGMFDGEPIYGVSQNGLDDAAKGKLIDHVAQFVGFTPEERNQLSHAEGQVLLQMYIRNRIKNGGKYVPMKEVKLYVDRITCENCRERLAGIAKKFGIEKLQITDMYGTTIENVNGRMEEVSKHKTRFTK